MWARCPHDSRRYAGGTNRRTIVVPLLLLWALGPLSVGAADILVCDFTGTAPGANTPWTQTSFLADGVEFSGWELGAGAVARAEIDDAFGFNVNGPAEAYSTLAESIAENEYVGCGLAPAQGGTLDLSGMEVRFTVDRLSWFSPRRYAVFASGVGFAEGDALFTTRLFGNEDYVPEDFSFFLPGSGVTGSVEFRIYAFEAQYNHQTALAAFSISSFEGVLFSLVLTPPTGGSIASTPEGEVFRQGASVQILATPDAGGRFGGWGGDLSGFGNPRTIVMDRDWTVAASFEESRAPAMRMGTNVASVVDWSTDWVFVDAFKMARTWLTRETGSSGWESGMAGEMPVDADGWPTGLPFVASDGKSHFAHTLFPAYAAGEYTMLVEGTGSIKLRAETDTWHSPTGGTTSFTVHVAEPKNLFIEIHDSMTTDPVRNIRCVMPGFENTYGEEPFHPLFLERLGPFVGIRYMDWHKTNGSPLAAWADRTTPGSFTQTRREGTALEYAVELSNTLGQLIWVCIPHLADDDSVRRTAELLRDSVGAQLKIYVEYSNETWNGMFAQTTYVQDRGEALNLDPERWVAGQKYVSLRSAQVWKIFEEEFAGDSRLVKVLATQSAGVGLTNVRVAALLDPTINPDGVLPDTLAIAPYFGIVYSQGYIDQNGLPTVDDVLDVASPAEIEAVRGHVREQKQIADRQGWDLICYEGGQHFVGAGGAENIDALTAVLTAANRDPRMYGLYRQYLDMLKAEGVELFCHWLYVGKWSKWGSWGSLEYQDQPVGEAPKYRALIDWAADNPTTPSGLNPAATWSAY